jgi:hypothetical protein
MISTLPVAIMTLPAVRFMMRFALRLRKSSRALAALHA